MKLEEINRTIAEKCGWRIEQCGATWMLRKPPEDRVVSSGHRADHDIKTIADYQKVFYAKNCLPDYYHDLNAVHEAEAWLDDKDVDTKSMYWDYLCLVCWPEEAEGSDTFIRDYAMCRSTAPQRCEALLRTWGLWKESE